MRVFDQRNLEHSTIIYETTPHSPLLRAPLVMMIAQMLIVRLLLLLVVVVVVFVVVVVVVLDTLRHTWYAYTARYPMRSRLSYMFPAACQMVYGIAVNCIVVWRWHAYRCLKQPCYAIMTPQLHCAMLSCSRAGYATWGSPSCSAD